MKKRSSSILAGALATGLVGSLGCNMDALTIDIRPGSDLNEIDTESTQLVPVAIHGSSEYSLLAIDTRSLAFGPDGAAPINPMKKADFMDVNYDGYADLVLRFRANETGLSKGAKRACLTGLALDGTPFEACDYVTTGALDGKGVAGRKRKGPKK